MPDIGEHRRTSLLQGVGFIARLCNGAGYRSIIATERNLAPSDGWFNGGKFHSGSEVSETRYVKPLGGTRMIILCIVSFSSTTQMIVKAT